MDYDFPDVDVEDMLNYIKRHRTQRFIDNVCEYAVAALLLTPLIVLAFL